MKAVKLLAIVLGVYLGLVVAFESLVVIMGRTQAPRGVRAGESWLVGEASGWPIAPCRSPMKSTCVSLGTTAFPGPFVC